ncbi:hypothetical protein FQR65_LT09279 [Abscondita terminalis]|nr:hypothetical protein FQR65_LT09279 [Abscondita terminalis]
MFVDLEKILRSNQAFLLGNWLNAAKRIGLNSQEVGLYEYNARNQITLWGPNGEIIDYANKQWSGMVSDYYFLRWQMFTNAMNESLINQTPINEPAVIRNIFQEVESPFTFSCKEFPIHPSEFSNLDHLKTKVGDDVQTEAVKNLLIRLIGDKAEKFLIRVDGEFVENGKEAFQLQKLKNGSVLVTGTTGVCAATGINHYLKYYCLGQVSWQTSNLNIPEELPNVNVTVASHDRFRYYQNVCTASYSFVWWTWADWEKHIDWIVLNSYNLVLSLNGLEAIWKRVYSKLSLTDEEINEHIPGPAFLAWGRMGNIRGWGGPLPESWHLQSLRLQHQILNRMREFGIVTVLPAFAGHVPRAFKRIFPDVKLTSTPVWNKFNDTYCCPFLLEPTEPLFGTVGKMFMKEVHEFRTDHIYSCDTFNEMLPTNKSESYLQEIGRSVYSAMTSSDPQAIWLMQGWLFIHEVGFWTDDRIKALLTSVPLGKMIVLDLQSEQYPQYRRLKSYFGQPFIWCMLHNFGATLGMFGSVFTVNKEVHAARTMENSTMIGTGLTPEGINQNYVVYDLMSESSWRTEPINLTQWITLYTIRRYGQNNTNANQAWQILKATLVTKKIKNLTARFSLQDTVYNFEILIPMRGKYVLTRRPSTRIEPWIWYDKCDLLQAWDHLLQAEDLYDNLGYRHDLVDTTRQVLQVFIDAYYKKVRKNFRQYKVNEFQNVSTVFLDMFLDVEKILKSNKEFLLGNWLNAAKRLGLTEYEKTLYEYNARNQITLWGPNGEIFDYANKQWSGMVSDYYFERWSMFINAMNESLVTGAPFNETKVLKEIFTEVEERFTFSNKIFSDQPIGDSVAIAQEIRNKIWNLHHCRFARGEDANFEGPVVMLI